MLERQPCPMLMVQHHIRYSGQVGLPRNEHRRQGQGRGQKRIDRDNSIHSTRLQQVRIGLDQFFAYAGAAR